MQDRVKQIVVAGATGLIGRELLRQLALRQDVRATALVRKSGALAHAPSVRECVFAYGDARSYQILGSPELPCDVLFCALGTTQKIAGSKAAFQEVDRDFPLRLAARLAAVNPQAIFGLVSAIGAAKPVGFYLKTKAEVEAGLEALGLRRILVRPSLLLGDRAESRPGEAVAAALMPALYRLGDALRLTQGSKAERYRPVDARVVAGALIHSAIDLDLPREGALELEGAALFSAGDKAAPVVV